MKPWRNAAIVGAAVMTTALSAHAEFTLVPTPSASRADAERRTEPIVLNKALSTPQPDRPQKPQIPVAHGFGNQVPLGFAVRQIVPAQVRVTFGPTVDQSAAVTWAGGKPWHDTLRAAVKPLGLHVAVGWKTVFITAS